MNQVDKSYVGGLLVKPVVKQVIKFLPDVRSLILTVDERIFIKLKVYFILSE